jgi:iron complex transport system ATP-binding protein
MNAPLIEVKELSFGYGEMPVLDRVSFSVRSGERLAIIGPNGAGKSTLLKSLMRMVGPLKGDIALQGRPANSYSQKSLARIVSYVPQADGRQFPFTVRDFVAMGRYPHLSAFTPRRPADEQAVDQAIAQAGLEHLVHRPMDQLSGGERQRLFIAAAIAQEAPVLLLDEPTTFLDPRHQQEVDRVLVALHTARRVTMITVTHDLNRALRHSDRILALKAGRVHFLGAPAHLLADGGLETLFERPFVLSTHPGGGPVILPD